MNKYEPGRSQRTSEWEDPLERLNRATSPSRSEEDNATAFDLHTLLGLARRQKWTIAGTILLGVGLGALYVSQVERQYTATAMLVIDTSQSEALGITPGLNDSLGAGSVVSTEIEIIKSQAVLLRAAESLDLPNSISLEKRPSRFNGLLQIFGLGVDPEAEPSATVVWDDLQDFDRVRWAVALRGHLDVTTRGTNVIAISATAPVPTDSAAWANEVVDAYLDEQVIAKLTSRERAIAFLRERVGILAIDVEGLEAELDAFIIDAIDRAGDPEARVALAELRTQLGVLEAKEAILADLQSAITSDDIIRLAGLIEAEEPGLIAEQDRFVAALAIETDAERAAAIRVELNFLEVEIRQAAQIRTVELRQEIAGQEQNMNQLEDELDDQVVAQALPNDILVDIFELQQDAQTTRELYSSYLTRLREAEQEGGLAIPDTRIIAEAVPPTGPSYPSIRSTLAMALLLSTAAGFGFAFVRENWIGGFAEPSQMERALSLPTLAAVPKFKAKKGQTPDWAIIDQPLSPYSESIRRTRLGLEAVADGKDLRLLVTSSVPGEGKTTMALSIARSFSKVGKRTILIDSDLRHPSVHHHTGGATEAGLIDYLLRGRDGSHMIVTQEEATGLTLVLGSEGSAVGTEELLLSARFANVVEYAAREFEVVVFDSPPVGLVVDAQVIAKEYATVSLFVVKAESTGRRAIDSALRDLTMSGGAPVVALLNQASLGRRYYGKYSNYYA